MLGKIKFKQFRMTKSYWGIVKLVDFRKCRWSVECNGGSILLAGLIWKYIYIIW